jgi:Ca2+-binding EF-hand superfamily protein
MKKSKFYKYFAKKTQAKPAEVVSEPKESLVVQEVADILIEAFKEPEGLVVAEEVCEGCTDENCEKPCEKHAEEPEEKLLVRDVAKSLKISNRSLVKALKEVGVKATHASKITLEELEEAKKVLK